MADTLNAEEIQKALEKQIADLQKEVSRISKTLSERGAEFYETARGRAEDVYGDASQRATGAMRQLRTRADIVSEVARKNPGTATTVIALAGFVGFILGVAVASASSGNYRRWR